MEKLTTRTLEALKPKPKGRREVADALTPGLYVIVSPQGLKAWSFRYTAAGGERRKVGLGKFPTVGLAAARHEVARLRVGIEAGCNPAADKRKAKFEARSPRADKPCTVGDLWALYERKTGKGRAKTTQALYEGLWRVHVAPRLAYLTLAEADRATLRLALEEIGDATRQGANNAKIMLSGMFNWALDKELITANPLARLAQPYPSPERDRFMGENELRAFWSALADAVGRDAAMSVQTASALKLALLTGMRGSAIVGLHAREINLAERTWTVPAERMKGKQGKRRPHVVPLSALAVDVLSEAFAASMGLTEIAGQGPWAGFAFPQKSHPSQPMLRTSLTQAMRRLVTAYNVKGDAEIDAATVHDLRRTLRTHLTGERLGISRETAERVIGHVVGSQVERTYDRNSYLAAKRQALDAWAALVLDIVNGKARATNVVPLGAARVAL